VRRAVGEVTLDLVLTSVADATLEKVLDEVLKVIPADDSGGKYDNDGRLQLRCSSRASTLLLHTPAPPAAVSISKLREDYEAMAAASALAAAAAAKAAAEAAAAAGDGAPAVVLTRKTAAELGNVKADVALTAVRASDGAFNWFLCDSAFNFVNAGSLSAPEMAKWLADDMPLFGLLRMSFGAGKFKRLKWITVSWPGGAKVGMVARAKATGARAGIKAKLGAASVDIEANTIADISLDNIIDKVKRSTAVDGATEGGEDPYSVSVNRRGVAASVAGGGGAGRHHGVADARAYAQPPLPASPPAGRQVYEGAAGGGRRLEGVLWRQGPRDRRRRRGAAAQERRAAH